MTNYTPTIHFIPFVCSVFSSQVNCSKHNTKDNKDKRSWIPYLKLTPVFCINFPILHASFSTHYPETMLLLLSLRSLQKCISLSVNTITSHDLGKEIVFVKFSFTFRLICWYLFLRWKFFSWKYFENILETIALKNFGNIESHSTMKKVHSIAKRPWATALNAVALLDLQQSISKLEASETKEHFKEGKLC